MLSIGKLGAAGGAEYYLDKVANNVDDYYLGRGEAPGQWVGQAATELGLAGQVDPGELRNLLAGMSAAGEALGLQVQPGRRPGYDLTFSAPKGLSLLWAFGTADVRNAISMAHDQAVASVIDHLSVEACFARRGHGGAELVEANGFIGAAFRHRTSRAGDPQLHTHVVVPNLVQGTDGRWSAPDGRHLYTWKMTAGTLYRSALRAELAPLGLAWDVRRNGLSELRDVPKAILRAFSKRRVDIETAMEVRGTSSQKSAETAALDSRERKPAGGTEVDVRRETWVEELSAIQLSHGIRSSRPAGVDDVTAALGVEAIAIPSPAEVAEVFGVLAGEKGASLADWSIDEQQLSDSGLPGIRMLPVTLLESSFSRREVLSAMARAFDVTPEEAVALTAAFLEREDVVRVLADPDVGPDHLRTKRGHLVPVTSGDRRYTTTELLAAEQRIVRSAIAGVGTATAQVEPAIVEEVLRRHGRLDGEQANGVSQLLTSGNRYDLVIGQAGTGKSTMLGAARVGWEEAGFRVIGTAVAARTAADLEGGTGIPSSSLTQLLADLREGGGLTSRFVIVVDEASMVGTRPLDRLRSYVDAAGAKLVLVGDNRQLSSIDAGGALRSLSAELGEQVVTLTTNRRQAGAGQQWEREALAALREGNVAPAVTAYAENGRVTIAGTIDEARQRIIEDWWAVHRDPAIRDQTTAILAVRRVDVSALNELVRARRQSAGELGEELRIGGKAFSVGDRVVFERNQRVEAADRADSDRRQALVRVRNGTFATVVAIRASTEQPFREKALTREGDVALRQELVQGDVVHAREGDVARTEGDVARDLEEQARSEPTGSLVVQLDNGERAILPASYLESSTSLGYALTVFRSQGITVDHAFGLGGDTLYQEAGYTQLSRGRLSNNLYVAAPDNPRWEIGHHADDLNQRDALQSLADALGQSREQTMARDRLPTWPTVSQNELDAAYREHATLSQWMAENAPPDVTRQLADAYMRTVDDAGVGHSDPQVQDDVKELLVAQREREAWVAAHRTEIATWSGLNQDIQRYEYRLGQAASFSQPKYVTVAHGPLPDRVTEVERWQTAAGSIEAYRLRWGLDAPTAIGPEPEDLEQRDHWRQAVGVIESAGFDPPDTWWDPDGSRMAALWERLDALTASSDRAQADRDRQLESGYKAPAIDWGLDDDYGYDNDYGIDDDYGYGL
jgi:conjugative relaxase-like TrwC/TraI family protein